MKKNLETLIQELCPDGVEFVKLGEVGIFYGGLSGKSKADFTDGNAKFITYMNVYSNPSLDINIEDKVQIKEGEKQNTVEYGDILFTGSSETPDECGMTSVLTEQTDEKLYLNSFCFGYRFNDVDSINPGYMKHLFRSHSLRKALAKTASGVTRFNVSKKKVAKIEIPLPPLEVQTEIVRILDKFTSLEAELEAELDCRKRQYEYYRDKLLSFDNVGGQDVEWKKMSEVGTFIRGNGLQKKDFTEAGVGCIHYGQLYTHYGTSATKTITYCSPELATKLRKASKGDVVIATTSENVEDVCKAVAWLGDNDVAVSGDAFIYKHNQNPKYMAYLFQTLDFFNYKKKKATGTKVIRLSGDAMGNYLAPIPPLAEQERIVSILDRFESLTTSLTAGLPAEIAARRQQYEHYRDKLLTFKRKSA